MTHRLAAACAVLVLAAPAFAQMPADLPTTSCNCGSADALTGPAPGCAWGDPPSATMPNVWLSAEYLFAWIPGNHLPPLITSSPQGTPRAAAGVLEQPNTHTIFGGDKVTGGMRSGLRFGAGYWFDNARTFGIEAGTMIIESQAAGTALSSTGNPILARPIGNVATGAPDSILVAYPGVSTGSVAARDRSGNFYEAHIDLAENMVDKGWFRLDTLFGYRFFRFNEGLDVQEVDFPLGAGIPTGTKISTFDSFGTQNEFNGGDLGVRMRFLRGNFSADVLTKLGVGVLEQRVNINGGTVIAVPGSPTHVSSGGLLALSSNIGNFSMHHAGALLPEFGLNLGWQVLPYLKLRAGYSLLLLNSIARAGNQVDVNVNPTLIPRMGVPPAGPSEPNFTFNAVDVWLQSLSLGIELTF